VKAYKIATILTFFTTIIFFLFALFFNSIDEDFWSNISIGVFSSSLLVLITSIISYIQSEKSTIQTYFWKLNILQNKILVLSTMPEKEQSTSEYYKNIKEINELLLDYFTICDLSFFDVKRETIKLIFHINEITQEYYKLSRSAEINCRNFICDKCDKNGQKIYSKERFLSEIKDYVKFIDNYNDTKEPYVIYLNKKIRELGALISKKAIARE